MKKFITAIVLLILFLGNVPAFASTNTPNHLTGQQSLKTEASRMEQRLVEIRKMDIKNMTSSERKTLRNEVLNIKQKSKDVGGGVYISGGALILIIILLIILF